MGCWIIANVRDQLRRFMRASPGYRELAERKSSLVDLLSDSPLARALRSGDLELQRSRDLPRDVHL